MDLRAHVTSILLSGSVFAQERCPPLTAWPDAPYAMHGDILERHPGLEEWVLAESEKLPGIYREVLARHASNPLIIFSLQAPSAVEPFADLDTDTLTTAGIPMEESAAFVRMDLMIGYYNPLRVPSRSISPNVYLHENGHLLYEALGVGDAELSARFDEASAELQKELEPYYPQLDWSDEAYKRIMLHEAFAESIAHFYHDDYTRKYFEVDYPELAEFMLALEDHAIDVLDSVYAFGFDERCVVAHLINPLGWKPQTNLNAPEDPR